MKVVIEFYRTREADDAHAVVGREITEAADLDDAVEIAWHLSQSLDMPQHPDALAITDEEGNRLYSGVLCARAIPAKVRSGFAFGIALKTNRALPRFR
nr:hypothetical protein [Mesorhizobium loti]